MIPFYDPIKGEMLSITGKMHHNGESNYIYRMHRHSTTEWKMVKARYNDRLNFFVHELVHYRLRYLRHGRKFEDPVRISCQNYC